jgi:hypothetical protein
MGRKVGISCTTDSARIVHNICAADISLKVISPQLKGYTSTEWHLFVV